VSNPGKPHLYHVAARLCILSPNFTFPPQAIPLFPSDSLLFNPPTRLRWRPNGRTRILLRWSFLPSTPTASCRSQVTICLLSRNRISSALLMLEFFLRRSFVLGGFAVGSLFRQKIPTSPLSTYLFLSAALLFLFLPSSAVSLTFTI
jgi:hypothetical protein